MGLKLLAILLMLGLAACSQPAQISGMIAPVSETTRIDDASPLRDAIEIVMVEGGRATNPLWISDVGNPEFRAALQQSLALHRIAAQGAGPLRLEVRLTEIDQPLAGISMTVSATVRYTLRAADGAVVFDQPITNTYTAEFSDAFMAVERLQLANEGAMRGNIASFIAALKAEAERSPALFAPATS